MPTCYRLYEKLTRAKALTQLSFLYTFVQSIQSLVIFLSGLKQYFSRLFKCFFPFCNNFSSDCVCFITHFPFLLCTPFQ